MIMSSAGCKRAGPLAICDFCKKKFFLSEKQIFPGEKAFFQTEMEISTFQDAEHNLNGAP